MAPTDPDHAQAAREARARAALRDAGAAALPRPPWLHRDQPPAALDLIRFALWRDATSETASGEAVTSEASGEVDDRTVLAALTLLPAARAELDQLEAAVLLTARTHGLSWSRISRALGLASAQAAQQRCDRVTGRTGARRGPA